MTAERITVASRKGIFDLVRKGRAWVSNEPHFLGDRCMLTATDPRTGTRWASFDLGHFGPKLRRSDDGGATWREVACPVFPEKPADWAPTERPLEGEPVAWRLRMIWAISFGTVDEPGRIWLGTLPGGLFKSDDDGATWQLCDSLWLDDRREAWFGGGMEEPAIHSVCVDPHDGERVSIAVSCGGVWHTIDDGDTWALSCDGMRAAYLPGEHEHNQNAQDPHYMVASPSDPSRMWVQHHNAMFRSDDAGRSWAELTNAAPSGFGFAVAVHPHEPDTAWFVPAIDDEHRIPVDGRLVVSKTVDAGETFEVIENGLPSISWDLVLRHALDVCDEGRVLSFGTTTGNLFVSEDGGACWASVHTNLPPIHGIEIV